MCLHDMFSPRRGVYSPRRIRTKRRYSPVFSSNAVRISVDNVLIIPRVGLFVSILITLVHIDTLDYVERYFTMWFTMIDWIIALCDRLDSSAEERKF